MDLRLSVCKRGSLAGRATVPGSARLETSPQESRKPDIDSWRPAMKYDFLIETYETERVKVISAWSMFRDDDLAARPNASDGRGRSLHEHMVHQCVSEDFWFRTMLGIDVGAPPLPK